MHLRISSLPFIIVICNAIGMCSNLDSYSFLDDVSFWSGQTKSITQDIEKLKEYCCWGREGELDLDSSVILDNSCPGRLLAEMCTDGKENGYPAIYCRLSEVIDLSCYNHLSGYINLTSCYSIQDKRIVFSLKECDCHATQSFELGSVVLHQGVWEEINMVFPANYDKNLRWLELKCIDNPMSLDPAHKFYADIEKLQLECVDDSSIFFDGQIYKNVDRELIQEKPTNEIVTKDGFYLGYNDKGHLVDLKINGELISKFDNKLGGFLAKDISTSGFPEIFDCNVVRKGNSLFQKANIGSLGLELDAVMIAKDDYIEISGRLNDQTNTERYITLYFALPLVAGDWQWGGNINKNVSVFDYKAELKHENHYPLSTMTLSKLAGLGMAIRMDEPVVYRFVYNPKLGIYYVAFDYALIPEVTVKGKTLNSVPFRFIIYKHDPKWGFRSALKRYYEFYPEFFVNRVDNPGGWGIWRKDNNPPDGYLDDGFRFSWGHEVSMLQWHKQHGVYNLLYLEPEYHQLSMGDFKNSKTATPQRAWQRVKKMANLDPNEMKAYSKLYFWSIYGGRFSDAALKEWGHQKNDFWQQLSQSVLNSAMHTVDGKPKQTVAGGRQWFGDSLIGSMIFCDLDPDIPQGKGWLNTNVYYKNKMKVVKKQKGLEVDGFSLDSFLTCGPNFRRDHFKYSDFPLSFTRCKGKPIAMIPSNFSTIEWLIDLKGQFPEKLMMANLSCCNRWYYSTFALPYLDIFGIEDRRVDDPEFFRSMAYHKVVTDLPHHLRGEQQVKQNLLYGIFHGDGHDKNLKKKYFPILQKLDKAGWEPIPYAKADCSEIIIERYGHEENLYFVIHNKNNVNAVTGTIRFSPCLEISDGFIINALTKEKYHVRNNILKINIAPLDTIVIKNQSE